MATHNPNDWHVNGTQENTPARENVRRFLEVLGETAADLGLDLEPNQDGTVTVIDRAGGPTPTLNIRNLYRQVAHVDEAKWKELITRFLRSANAATLANVQEVVEAGLDGNAERVLPTLKLPPQMEAKSLPWFQSLFAEDDPQAEVIADLARTETGAEAQLADLGISLAIDLPESMAFVTEAMLEKSSRSAADWLETALDNLHERTPADWYTVAHDESGICAACVQDCYDAARALILDRLLPEEAPHGWLVAPISRDYMYFMAARENAGNWLIVFKRYAEDRFRSVPYPLCDELFWVYGGTWSRFPVLFRSDGQPVVAPPEELAHLLGWHSRDAEDDDETA